MSIIEQINKTYDHYWRSLFIRVGLVVLTTVLIVYFLPKNEGLQFNFRWVSHGITARSSLNTISLSTRARSL